MILYFRVMVSFLLITLAFQLNASFKYPILINAEKEFVKLNGNYKRYKVTIQWATVELPDEIGNIVPGNFSHFGSVTRVPANPLMYMDAVEPTLGYSSNFPGNYSDTWREISDKFYEKYQESGIMTTTIDVLGSMYQGTPFIMCLGGHSGGAKDLITVPVEGLSDCITTTPDDIFCEFDTPSLDFNFGRQITHHASGMSQSEDISVSCNGSGFKFYISALPYSTVKLSNGMEAKLTVDGKSLASHVVDMQDNTIIPLTVTLSGEPLSSGAFSGNAILRINYN